MIRITTPRAIIDWLNRPATLAESQQPGFKEQKESTARLLPGVVGRTRFRVVWELNEQLAQNMINRCDEALAGPLSDSLRNAIHATRRQVALSLEEWRSTNA